MDVICLGRTLVDCVFSDLTQLPNLGEEIWAPRLSFELGGGAPITAVALSRLGMQTGLISNVGKDPFSTLALSRLRAGGVDISHVRSDVEWRTDLTVVLSTSEDRCFVTHRGTPSAVPSDERTWAYLSRARHIHALLHSDSLPLLERAKNLGLTISLDLSWDRDKGWNEEIETALQYTDVFLPSKEDALRLTGKDELEEALLFLGQRARTCVIKMGKEGAIGLRGADVLFESGFVVEAVDTTGAGDAFNGGFILGFLSGFSLRECLQLGNACGALSVTSVGGIAGLPTLEQVGAFLRQQGLEEHTLVSGSQP